MILKDKVAVVTGGASGLGSATVRRFVRAGAKVVILDLNEDKGNDLAEELGSESVKFLKTDIGDTDNVKNAVEFTLNSFGHVDILVNCAAFPGKAAKTADLKRGMHDLDTFRKVMLVNIVGTFDVIRSFGYHMLSNEPNDEGGRGVIINCASVAGIEGQMGQVGYGTSKAAMIGMATPIARDFAKPKIRVCTICPGIMDTPMMATVSEQVKEALGQTVLNPQRLGIPDEFAHLAQAIVENAYLNMESIRLDGGIRMQPR